MTRVREAFPGLIVSALLATAALMLAETPFIRDTLHLSALLLVILAGMALTSFVRAPAWTLPGIRIAQRPVLRWAVAGLGFRLLLGEILQIGAPALVVVVVSTTAAIFFGFWIARRLGVGEKLALLLGVGGAICGASAVVAADSVVQSEKRDSAIALGVITLLGTVGIVVYPWIGRALSMGDFAFGLWDGASLHEMAQVVAAASGFSDAAKAIATVVKLTRITMLAPVVFALAWWLGRRGSAGEAKVSPVPWFLVMFVLFAALNSSGVVPAPWLDVIRKADLWLLCVGMAGVGLQTGFHDLRAAGWAPIAAGAAQWVFLAVVSLLVARAVGL